MTYAAALRFLYSRSLFGIKMGLANMRALAAAFDHPERLLRFIHIAGTNGKGSTAAMLESIYRYAGYRVGLYTSPHLLTFRERIQVNRQLIPCSSVAKHTAKIAQALYHTGSAATFFEVVTLLALLHFREKKCQLIIWETGMGGRLDATNIVTPLTSVITHIDFDHQAWLGNTLEKIAFEKAGIIKATIPVVTAVQSGPALEVIRRVATAKHAPLTHVAAKPPERAKLNLPGRHQLANAACAQATVAVLASKFPVSNASLKRGLSQVYWPGRLQWISHGKNRRTLLDGAHNPSGARALADFLSGQRFTLILGILQDKNISAICEILAPRASEIHVVPVKNPRTAAPEELARLCAKYNPPIHSHKSLEEALRATRYCPVRVVTGSLYLIAEALSLLLPRARKQTGKEPALKV